MTIGMALASEFTGTPAKGDVWTLTVDNVDYTYTVPSNSTTLRRSAAAPPPAVVCRTHFCIFCFH